MAVKADNSLWAWGINTYGQLGNDTETEQRAPVKIMDNVSSAFAGINYSFVITADGSLWGSGWNRSGQLGDGTEIIRNSFV